MKPQSRPNGGGFLYAVKDYTDIDASSDRWEQIKREHAEWLKRDDRSPWIRLACYVYLQSELPAIVSKVRKSRGFRILRLATKRKTSAILTLIKTESAKLK